jgi:hypothetical protein
VLVDEGQEDAVPVDEDEGAELQDVEEALGAVNDMCLDAKPADAQDAEPAPDAVVFVFRLAVGAPAGAGAHLWPELNDAI